MKKLLYKAMSVLTIVAGFNACSLDEYNPYIAEDDISLSRFADWIGQLNNSYTPLFSQLFTTIDYWTMAEGGTDCWLNARGQSYSQQLLYYDGLSTNTGASRNAMQQMYTAIGSCNSVINKADAVEDGDPATINCLVGEAYFLRGFYHLLLTTYYGNISLALNDADEEIVTAPQRNTYEEIYTQIISDLYNAFERLDVEPYEQNNGRATKKAALGMLARAYAQGAGEGLSENGVSYWQRAKEVAEDFIENMEAYGAHLYENVDDVWAHTNNRNNAEALFVATGPRAGDASWTYRSSDGSNMLAHVMCNPYALNDIYPARDNQNYLYGRVNMNVYAPSKYVIDVFDADYDKRYENTFITAFCYWSLVAPGWGTRASVVRTISDEVADKYGMKRGAVIHPYTDLNNANHGSTLGGNSYWADHVWPKGYQGEEISAMEPITNVFRHPYPLDADEDRFFIYLSKDYLTPAEKLERGYVCINIDDLFEPGGTEYRSASFDGTESYRLFPSYAKLNWSREDAFVSSSMQRRPGDIFIMRMAEVYLIAAEANVALGHPEIAVNYINPLRRRACRNAADFEAHMQVNSIDENGVLDEFTRELVGEFQRWAILKRHRAIGDRLQRYNRRAANLFNESIHYLRPISSSFLNQIDNPEEYGTNGY